MADTLLHNTEQRIQDLQFQLQYLLKPIENSRIEIRKRSRLYWTILLVVFSIAGGLFAYFRWTPLVWVSIALLIGAIILYFLWINSPRNVLIGEFNKNIVPHIVAEFLSQANFDAENFVSMSEYRNSNIFRTGVDRYTGNSFISGSLGDTSMKFSKLHSEYKTETRSKNGGTKTTWHTIFKGVFLIADSNKHFQGETYIFPDTAERAFGGIGRWLQEKVGSSGRGEMVYMEDPVFEKLYVVYATDPVEARYLLTPSMQQYFIELANYLGKDSIHASFIDGKLYLALKGNFDLFSFKMNMSLTDTETIRYYTKNLLHILSVVEILDLNTRIWGK